MRPIDDDILCECGRKPLPYRTLCGECARKRREDRYYALPLVEWDGESALWDERYQTYIGEGFIEGEAMEWSEDDHPWLTPCVSMDPPMFSMYEFLRDVFDCEDRDLPDGWEEAERAVNDYARSIRKHLDWRADRTRRIDWRDVREWFGVETEEDQEE